VQSNSYANLGHIRQIDVAAAAAPRSQTPNQARLSVGIEPHDNQSPRLSFSAISISAPTPDISRWCVSTSARAGT
jgi:hypothetical protein